MNVIILWLCFFFCIAAGTSLSGLSLKSLIQPTAAIMTFVPVISYLGYSCGKDLFRFPGRLLRGDGCEEDIRTVECAASLGFVFGAISMAVGVIAVLSNLSDPARMGGGMAVAVVSVIYASVPAILLLPLRRRPSPFRGSGIAAKSAAFMVVASLALTLNFFMVLYAVRG